jgi:hypothetical protein
MAVIAAIAAVSVSASASAEPVAEPAAINYRVCGGPAPIHTSYSSTSPTIGYLQNGEVFGVTQNSLNGFDYGYAYGSVHAYGYMNRHFEC